MKEVKYLVFVAAATSLYAAIIYVREMFKGQAKPNKVSWLLWTVAPMIGAIAAFSQGVGWAAIPTFMSAASTLIIFVFAFIAKGSYWDIRRFDVVCGAISLATLVIWYFSRSADLAITFAILSDIFATAPTAVKAWKHPETEVAGPFAAGVFNASTSYFALTSLSFASLAFPTYLLAVNAVMALIIERKRLKKRNRGLARGK